jgi:hypothetical protein
MSKDPQKQQPENIIIARRKARIDPDQGQRENAAVHADC